MFITQTKCSFQSATFESCRRGQMVGTKKTSPQPRKNDPNKQPVSPKFLAFTAYNFFDQKIHPFNRTSLCISLALALVVWESLDLTTREVSANCGSLQRVICKGKPPPKNAPKKLRFRNYFCIWLGVSEKKKGYPIIVGFPLFINHAKKVFFFPIYFFWKHPYRINIICSGWVSSVKFPLAGDPLQSLYDSRPYLPDLVFRGGGKLGWTQDELRVKILGSGSFTIPIFPNCTSLIWFAGTSEDRWIFRKNIGWRYHPIMVRKMWKDDGDPKSL